LCCVMLCYVLLCFVLSRTVDTPRVPPAGHPALPQHQYNNPSHTGGRWKHLKF
jgi:hypothetical protein